MKLKGFKTYRHASNPIEKKLHDNFVKELLKVIDIIIFPAANQTQTIPSDVLSDREKRIILTTIQWLGSPVGQMFLKSNGFYLDE